MRKIPNINTYIFKQPVLPWISSNLFLAWGDIDLDVFSLQDVDGFNGEKSGAGAYGGNAKTTPLFTLANGESVRVTLDEVYALANEGTISIQLWTDSAGALDSGTVLNNTDDQVFTLTNNDGQGYSDLEIRISLFGFGQTTNTEIRNTVINLL